MHSRWLFSYRSSLQHDVDRINALNWTMTGDKSMKVVPSDFELVSTTIRIKTQKEVENEDSEENGREDSHSPFPTTLVSVNYSSNTIVEHISETNPTVIHTSVSSVPSMNSDQYVKDLKMTYSEKVVYYDWGDQKYGKYLFLMDIHHQ